MLNVYETFFKFLLRHKFGQKSANFGQFKSWPITIVLVIKNPLFYTNFARNWQKKANLSPKKTYQAFWIWVTISFHFLIFPKILGHNVLFGQIVTLGIKSIGKMSSWANCHIGHKVFGQYVILGIMTLGILKTWAF